MPKMSIITACYNHGHFLGECITSVLAQTEQNIEHIIVIDGATDNSLQVAASFSDERLDVTCWENHGLAASQNLGIEMASAPWVLKVDADDYISPTYVEEILTAADADPRRNVIFSPAHIFGGKTEQWFTYPPFDPARMIDVFMIPGPSAFRKDMWDAVGGYDETMRSAEDWDLYVRAQLAVGLVPHQLPYARWHYRQHGGPRASAAGMRKVAALKQYWRGHTRETVLARSRNWGAWCEMKGLAA